jgi:hypothetical protein
VVVGWVSATASVPNPLTLIGTTVTVQEGSGGGGDCIFGASALTMTVTDALTGSAIVGATVQASGQTATTDSSGQATLTNLPTNQQVTVTVTASGYISQSMQVTIACGEAQQQGIALLSSTDTGVAAGDIRIILTWGENPRDLDSHLTGPKDGSSDRFHVYYSARNNCSSSPCDSSIPAWLDVDDTTSYGPETITIQKVNGAFVSGTYRYYIHHYAGSSDIPNSSSSIQVYRGSDLLRTFTPPSTSQSVGDDWVWSVFTMDVSSSGSVSISTVGTYSGTHSSSDSSIFTLVGGSSNSSDEVFEIIEELPEK